MNNTIQAPAGTLAREIQAPVRVRYCLYARKSSESEERQILSIDSQIKEMLQLAEREGLEVVDMKRESHSAKETGQRPIFNEIIMEIREGKYNGILTWAPDRISRNAGDLGKVVDLIDAGILIEIRTYSQRFTNSPNEKFLLMILGSQAKLENDNKSVNVKRGLRAKVEMGLWPSVAPTGYLNDKRSDHKGEVLIDTVRAPIIRQIFEKAGNDRWSGRRLYLWLRDEIKFTSKNGKALSLSTVYEILRTPFYSGVFEYPMESGNWYQGKHAPLITRELYQLVQEKINEESRKKVNYQEFTFTRLMKCGYCGSGVTAQEKSKLIKKDGSTHYYIYYSCTRHVDKFCKNPFIREDNLIEQLAELMDEVKLDELGTRKLIEQEVARYNSLREDVMGKKSEEVDEISVRGYAKHLLKKGSMVEKRALLANLKNRIVMKDKKIAIIK
jgi:site-specific DNA recombinase